MMDHPNIAKVLDAGCHRTPGDPTSLMELVKGLRYHQILRSGTIWPLQERRCLTCSVADPAGSGTARAHQKGIIHRDLKPSGIAQDCTI